MRGGLGKTLLLAFLLLTIFPLSLLAFLTYNGIRQVTREKVLSSLVTVVALKEGHLADWVDEQERLLALVAGASEVAPGVLGVASASEMTQGPELAAEWASWFEAMAGTGSALTGVVVVDVVGDGRGSAPAVVEQFGRVPAGAGEAATLAAARLMTAGATSSGLVWVEGDGAAVPAVCYVGERWALLGVLRPEALQRLVTQGVEGFDRGILTSLVAAEAREGGGQAVLVSRDGTARLGPEQAWGEAIEGVLAGGQGSGAYTDAAGQAVLGAYRWSAEVGVGLVAERGQAEALAAGDEVTALTVAATLGVALVSAAIAAVVTRRVTRPIVELTESAAWLARGDLNQQVAVRRRDEIGVLARAFNRMAAELRVLYGSLEAKVEERTEAWREANEALEEANEYTRYYVMQLAISAEVARIAASIRETSVMLKTVVELIGKAFELRYVAIYLVDASRGWAVWQVGAPADEAGHQPVERWVAVGGPTLVGRAAVGGALGVAGARGGSGTAGAGRIEKEVRPDGGWELAIPLQVRGDVLGVLVLESSGNGEGGYGAPRVAGWVPESDWVVYQTLADQISIAIENARAYAMERETVERLRELDRIQAEFLINMSHALRTPLNSVIGFSRVMLKELDGPLTEMQRADLTTIYEAGRQLLGLLNDMLDLSQLEMGVMSWSPGDVDLAEVIEGVMATTRALAMNKPIQLRAEVAEDLPALYTDGQRLRQVILALLSNAAKFTDAGTITLKAGRYLDGGRAGRMPAVQGAERERVCSPRDGVALDITIDGTGSEAGLVSVWEQGVGLSGNGHDAGPAQGGAGSDQEPLGAGFGLAVSKRVVEKLGGKVWLERQGEGLTFTLVLPVQRTEI